MISIPARHYSQAVWAWVDDQTYTPAWHSAKISSDNLVESVAPEYKDIMAGYQTAKTLEMICRKVRPTRIVEVGTFSGFTAFTMQYACDPEVIYTCDKDHAIVAEDVAGKIKSFPRTRAIDMLKTIQPPIDLFFLDGRVSAEEVDEMGRLASDDAVFVLDDWEGFEKGASNALLLYIRKVAAIPVFPQHGTQVGMMLKRMAWVRQ